MTEDVTEDLAARLSSIASLAEPARRDLYLYVAAQPGPVGRDQAAAETGMPRHAVKFHLDRLVDEGLLEVEFRRLSGRRTCKNCGHVWHIEYDKPKVDGVCDKCGGELYQRDDDHAETVRHRLEVYAAQTAPLIEFYDERAQLVAINALGTVEDVTERAIAALTPYAD